MRILDIVVLMDDWYLSNSLVKIANINGYNLEFIERLDNFNNSCNKILLIIDIDSLNEKKTNQLLNMNKFNNLFILGCKKEVSRDEMIHLDRLVYDMLIDKKKLSSSLGSIINQVLNAS